MACRVARCSTSPYFADGAGAGEYRRGRRELAVELADDGPAVGEFVFEADGRQRPVARGLRRINQERRARQGLEEGGRQALIVEIMRPGEAAVKQAAGMPAAIKNVTSEVDARRPSLRRPDMGSDMPPHTAPVQSRDCTYKVR